MRPEKKYHAFISYSHLDKSYASLIQKSIEALGLPFYKSWQPDIGIFRDERKIPLSGSLTKEIIEGLKESKYLIVIASKNSADSKWVKEEITNWHSLNKDENGFITNFNFILIDDVIAWDYENRDFDKLKTTALPKFEERIFSELPIWANLQHYCKSGKVQANNSNYEWEIAKIKGLLLGKKPDEIIDEVSKGKRAFRIIVGIAMLILLIATGVAICQRSLAINQKEIADKKTEEAIDNLRKYKLEEFERNLKNGNTYYDAEEYCFAKDCFTKAVETANDTICKESISQVKIQYLDSVYKICLNKSNCK